MLAPNAPELTTALSSVAEGMGQGSRLLSSALLREAPKKVYFTDGYKLAGDLWVKKN